MSRHVSWATQVRRIERENARRQRELAALNKQRDRWEERQRARYDVDVHENLIAFLLSMHRDCGPYWDWTAVANSTPPPPPPPVHAAEQHATRIANEYRSTFFKRVFGVEQRERAVLEAAKVAARAADAAAYAAACEEHRRQVERVEWERKVAAGVLRGDPGARRTVIDHLAPFEELAESGMVVNVVDLGADLAVLACSIPDESVVPRQELKLSAAGKLTTKGMALGVYWPLYQDYVCGCALRAAREMFALIPLERVIVNVFATGIDTSTGHHGERPILGVSITREVCESLRYDTLDPSDAVSQMPHRMIFKKTAGFTRIEPVTANESFVTTGRRRH